MDIRTQFRDSTDGRSLIAFTWERESPEADSPVVEAVFEVIHDEDDEDTMSILAFVSATRLDTREPVQLTTDESRVLLRLGARKLAEEEDRI